MTPSPRNSQRAFVGLIAFLASALAASVLYAGPYLPYTDWAKHAALIEILAHGDETGADAYWERTLRPTPYWSFYVAVAALMKGTGLDADLAGRLVVVIAAGLCVLALADLLRQTGRDARWCVLAPLSLLGLALGYGFGSFLCATPAAIFAMGRTEALLRQPNTRNTALLAAAHLLVLLGHGLWVLLVALALTARAAVLVVDERQRRRAFPWPAVGRGALAVVPAAVLGAFIAARPVTPTEHFSTFWVGADVKEHLDWMQRALVGQFVEPPVALALALALAVCFGGLVLLASRVGVPRHEDAPRWGLEVYALVVLLVSLVGPKSLGGPIQVYLIYPRFFAAALVLLLCVPRVHLRGHAAWLMFSLASAAVVGAGWAQRGVVVRASAAAADFDGVRRLVPRGSLALPLWAPQRGDPLVAFPGFWPGFWLGIDGARFTTGLFDFEAHPVFRRKDSAAPREVRGSAFQPEVHAREWEYVVVRGRALAARLDAAPTFSLVGTSGGYRVYRNTRLVPVEGTTDAEGGGGRP